jgi:hypothetical protein
MRLSGGLLLTGINMENRIINQKVRDIRKQISSDNFKINLAKKRNAKGIQWRIYDIIRDDLNNYNRFDFGFNSEGFMYFGESDGLTIIYKEYNNLSLNDIFCNLSLLLKNRRSPFD